VVAHELGNAMASRGHPSDGAVTSPTLQAGTRHLPDKTLATPVAQEASFVSQVYQDVLHRPAMARA